MTIGMARRGLSILGISMDLDSVPWTRILNARDSAVAMNTPLKRVFSKQKSIDLDEIFLFVIFNFFCAGIL